MQLIYLLMQEHRIIERMINVLENEIEKCKGKNIVNSNLIDDAVDFFKVYADELHHGKEENILFKNLEKKELSESHAKTMKHLVEEHKLFRKLVKQIKETNKNYKADCKNETLCEIQMLLNKIIKYYPQHIKIEDKHFFLEVINYFSKEENQSMLEEGYDVDKHIIHKKYLEVIKQYEKQV